MNDALEIHRDRYVTRFTKMEMESHHLRILVNQTRHHLDVARLLNMPLIENLKMFMKIMKFILKPMTKPLFEFNKSLIDILRERVDYWWLEIKRIETYLVDEHPGDKKTLHVLHEYKGLVRNVRRMMRGPVYINPNLPKVARLIVL